MISVDGLHIPKRGDAVEQWLRTERDKYEVSRDHNDFVGHDAYWALDDLIDSYRLHADTGMPIDQEVTE